MRKSKTSAGISINRRGTFGHGFDCHTPSIKIRTICYKFFCCQIQLWKVHSFVFLVLLNLELFNIKVYAMNLDIISLIYIVILIRLNVNKNIQYCNWYLNFNSSCIALYFVNTTQRSRIHKNKGNSRFTYVFFALLTKNFY